MAPPDADKWLYAIDKEVHVKQLMGYVQKDFEDKVYKLKKSLYGFKHGLLCWNKELNCVQTKLRFIRIKADHAVVERYDQSASSSYYLTDYNLYLRTLLIEHYY